MTRRRYSSAASETALTNSINNSVTAIVLDAVTGFPGSFPYELIIDYGTASEECILVTAGTGTSLTITRGFDGTTGLSHGAGAKVVHGASAIDFDEANAHVNETTTAHGLTLANLATKAGVEVLTNKDMTSGTNTFPAVLTGKTIALGSNTVSGTLAQLNAAITDRDVACAAASLSGLAIAAGQTSGTTDGSGNLTISTPTGLGSITWLHATATTALWCYQVSANVLGVRASNGTAAAGQSVTVNWIAIGPAA